jgi:hypothetical protein
MSDLKKMRRVGPGIETALRFAIAAAGAPGFEWATQCVFIVTALSLGFSKTHSISSSLKGRLTTILRCGSPSLGEAAD